MPRHDLRNGRLNQTAYSLFMFLRDLADGDIVSWIDGRVAAVSPEPTTDRPARLRLALLAPLGNVYGVSNKLLAMALSELLLAGDAKRPLWIEAGTVMIAVDTLVHNFLHRTGILRDFAAEHPYGPRCYAPGGCADIIERIAAKIDARRFNPASRRTTRALSSTPSGGFAPRRGSTAAMAAASTTGWRASRPNARCLPVALAWRSSRRKYLPRSLRRQSPIATDCFRIEHRPSNLGRRNR